MDDHLQVTDHALDRYLERVRPALTRTEALRDLRRLARRIGVVSRQHPAWVTPTDRVDAWLLLGEDVVLPMLRMPAGWMAKTTLTRGVLSDEARRARNRRNAARRFARTHKPHREGRPVMEEAA